MNVRLNNRRLAILAGAALAPFVSSSAAANPAKVRVMIAERRLDAALAEFSRQSHQTLLYSPDLVKGGQAQPVQGEYTPQRALELMLAGTGRRVRATPSGALLISSNLVQQSSAPRTQPVAVAPTEISTSDMPSGGQAEPARTADIIVTGSRIPKNGNDQPTPVTIVSTDQLAATTPTSIPDGLNKLPAFTNVNTPNNATSGANGRGFNTPGNYLNLRNLTAIRTLILQDGHRVPGTFYDTTVDADMLPQLLVQRVEVVTGGASAVYGSDAVSGVVNFIIDRKFVGVKGVAQTGVSKYGDARSVRAGIAQGMNIGDRGHFEWSAEYYNRNAIKDQAARPYGDIGASVPGAGTAANPYYLVFNARRSDSSYGGLARTGPFAGQQFRNDGTLAPFNPGTPTRTANVAVGGDGGIQHNEYLIPSRKTRQAFGRFDYDVMDNLHAYIEARYATAGSYNANQAFNNNESGTPLYIYSGNAFLRPEVQARLTAANASSFLLNRFNSDISKSLALDSDVRAGAGTVGLEGKLGRFNVDAFYSHGETRTKLISVDNINSQKFYAATDAVNDPATGRVVCRVTLVAPGAFPGCAPLNLFGENNASAAALDFIRDDTSWTAHNDLDDFGLNVAGTAFNGWAGPIKIALGGEYRRAKLLVTTTVPDTTFNPQYLRLGAAGNSLPGSYAATQLAYAKEVQAGSIGAEDIYEANVEADVPLLRDLPLVKMLTLNGAFRYTRYDANGNVNQSTKFTAKTWKLGLEWQVFNDLRIRATRSRDIRAPTLWDLYQQQIISGSTISDTLTGVAGNANTVNGGNPDLRPEVARNVTAGFVYRPSWLGNASIAIDYYNIRITNAISQLNGLNQLVQDICLRSDGSSPYCGLVVRPISYNSRAAGNFPTLIYALNQNIARVDTHGIDVEANYGLDLGRVGLPGAVSFRGLWTYQPVLKTESIPGAVVTDAAGTSPAPRHKVSITLNYAVGGFRFDIQQRFQSPIRWTSNPTLVFNIPNVRAYYQTDLGAAYDLKIGGGTVTAFVTVSNVLNQQGGILQSTGYTGSPGMNYPIGVGADLIGRYVTAGLRARF